MSTIGKTIRCKAAVTWDADKLSIEEVEIAPPKDKEVPAFLWPIIHGHEGSGIVESVGKDVTYVKPGDHVITTYIPRCGKCVYCNNNSTVVRTNFCQMFLNQLSGLMPDGTSRITCKVLTDENIVKINPRAPLDSVCLLACGLSTGYGGVTRIANMRIGSSVGVFGCGAVDKPIQQVLKELTGIGLDYTFDCTGNTKITIAALEATKIGTGESIVLGVSDKGEEDIGVALQQLMLGRYWKGGVFGNLIPKRDIPQLVEQYLDNKLEIDSLVTHRFKFVEINEAIKVMMSGDWKTSQSSPTQAKISLTTQTTPSQPPPPKFSAQTFPQNTILQKSSAQTPSQNTLAIAKKTTTASVTSPKQTSLTDIKKEESLAQKNEKSPTFTTTTTSSTKIPMTGDIVPTTATTTDSKNISNEQNNITTTNNGDASNVKNGKKIDKERTIAIKSSSSTCITNETIKASSGALEIATSAVSSSSAENKNLSAQHELIKKYFQAKNNLKLDDMVSIVSDDVSYLYLNKTNIQGKEAFKNHMKHQFEVAHNSFKDYNLSTKKILVEGNQAMVKWEWIYKHKGIAKNLGNLRIEGVSEFELKGLLIKSVKSYEIKDSDHAVNGSGGSRLFGKFVRKLKHIESST
ncbi:5941_t:CDS:10 [Entrophospora sp. SA101]|nr:5941_t:CDS:10 [Entrophospora sp. SA101]